MPRKSERFYQPEAEREISMSEGTTSSSVKLNVVSFPLTNPAPVPAGGPESPSIQNNNSRNLKQKEKSRRKLRKANVKDKKRINSIIFTGKKIIYVPISFFLLKAYYGIDGTKRFQKMDKNPPRNAKEELRKSSGDHETQA